jgi:hypothetical protein
MMYFRVRTLTGKEIELDIESDYKVHTGLLHITLPFCCRPCHRMILRSRQHHRAMDGTKEDLQTAYRRIL